MEIKDIEEYFINEVAQTLDVRFRLEEDSDDEIRVDEVNLYEIKDFGYDFVDQALEFYGDDEDEFALESVIEVTKPNLDYNELKMFLNEYYMIHPTRLPERQFY